MSQKTTYHPKLMFSSFTVCKSANRQIHKLVNSVFSAKEEMFLSNLHGLAGGSLIFTEQTEFTKFRICEFAYLQAVNEENISIFFFVILKEECVATIWYKPCSGNFDGPCLDNVP